MAEVTIRLTVPQAVDVLLAVFDQIEHCDGRTRSILTRAADRIDAAIDDHCPGGT